MNFGLGRTLVEVRLAGRAAPVGAGGGDHGFLASALLIAANVVSNFALICARAVSIPPISDVWDPSTDMSPKSGHTSGAMTGAVVVSP